MTYYLILLLYHMKFISQLFMYSIIYLLLIMYLLYVINYLIN